MHNMLEEYEFADPELKRQVLLAYNEGDEWVEALPTHLPNKFGKPLMEDLQGKKKLAQQAYKDMGQTERRALVDQETKRNVLTNYEGKVDAMYNRTAKLAKEMPSWLADEGMHHAIMHAILELDDARAFANLDWKGRAWKGFPPDKFSNLWKPYDRWFSTARPMHKRPRVD